MRDRYEHQRLMAIDADAKTRSWIGTYRQERAYHEKMSEINAGTAPDDVFFFGGEAVRYLLEKQHIDEPAFNAKLGFNKNYFRANLFNYAWNHGSALLPEPFRKRMSELTREALEKKGLVPEEFWCKRNYTPADLEGVFIDMTRDITPAQEQYPKPIPSQEAKQVLADLPHIAVTLLIDPVTSQWRRDTFLFDQEGNFKPRKTMAPIRYMIENHDPLEVIRALSVREQDDPYFYAKGAFMKAVAQEAAYQRLIPRCVEVVRYIPLVPRNSTAWSR